MTANGERWLDGGRHRRKCFVCGGPHKRNDCPTAPAPESSKGGGKSRGRGDCFKCGKPGHWTRSCPLNRDCPLNKRGIGIDACADEDGDGAKRSSLRRRLHEPGSVAAGSEFASSSTRDDIVPLLPVSLELSAEQQAVVDCASQGCSVFFTGCAGTGKSFLLREIITRLREQCPGDDQVAVCASTGIAAVNIGGITVHSWAGVGFGEGTMQSLLANVQKSNKKKSNWARARALVIDEISMLDGALLDALEFIARKVRNDERTFGGLQLVVCGDFFQLPPIGLERGTVEWCFNAKCWGRLVPQAQQFLLRHVFRQAEASFVALLDEVRHGGGALSLQTCSALQATERNTFSGGLEPTRLFSHNVDVDRTNETRLGMLSGQLMCFTATDGGQEPHLGQLQKHCIAPPELKLKVGAQVMLLKNIDAAAGLVNGARGVVQGFEPGKKDEMFPVVCIHVDSHAASGGGGLVTRTLHREEWTVELGKKVVARRCQVPLRLAWAISIHKSQGMTIDALEADLGSIFEYGQAYVALSRATSLARLRVLNFDASRVRSHPKVVEFYRGLHKLHGDAATATAPPDLQSKMLPPKLVAGNEGLHGDLGTGVAPFALQSKTLPLKLVAGNKESVNNDASGVQAVTSPGSDDEDCIVMP